MKCLFFDIKIFSTWFHYLQLGHLICCSSKMLISYFLRIWWAYLLLLALCASNLKYSSFKLHADYYSKYSMRSLVLKFQLLLHTFMQLKWIETFKFITSQNNIPRLIKIKREFGISKECNVRVVHLLTDIINSKKF